METGNKIVMLPSIIENESYRAEVIGLSAKDGRRYIEIKIGDDKETFENFSGEFAPIVGEKCMVKSACIYFLTPKELSEAQTDALNKQLMFTYITLVYTLGLTIEEITEIYKTLKDAST